MWRLATAVAAAAALLGAAPAQAQLPGPYGPWDGSNPFNCVIQDLGTGVDFPDPEADPFCVEFDKTQQNVTDFGIAEFLANEPIRVAAAVDKCFYYQSDHWTGSIVQGEMPELWHWDGQYFFDKAVGAGGVNIQNFRLMGEPASFPPGSIPSEYEQYFDQDGWGAYLVTDIPADPACAARVDTEEERAQVYATGAAALTPPAGDEGFTRGAPAGKSARKKCKRKKARTAARKRCKKKR